MINFIPITQCSPKWYCDACCTARAWRKRMAQRCPENRQHRVFFTWDHSDFKVWVVMKLMPYHGLLLKEYVGEILKSFDKFQVVPSSMEIFPTNLNGPLSPTVSRPSEGRAGRDTVGTGWIKHEGWGCFMDISKALDCLPPWLLISKWHACGLYITSSMSSNG